jgi:sigma-B regulation protein RsbU (phosphoserine phosphatase)
MDAELPRFLKQNKLLKGMTNDQLSQVEDLVSKQTYPAGAVIVRQSETPDRVFLLAEGRVEVRRRLPGSEENGIAELEAGDFFGEMAVIIGAAVHSASVIAVTPVTTLSLTTAGFTRLLSDFPETTRNILSNIILQLQDLNGRWLETLRLEKEVLERKVRERTEELEAVGEKVRRELLLAQNIQHNLLPERRKQYPGVSVATEYIPCDELGGDITGVFQIDENRLAMYGGDVCGHGIYAAMVMSYVKKLIETSVKRILLNRQYVVKPPGAVLTAINHSFIAEINQGDPEIYLTLFLGVLDLRGFAFEYASAGIHVPPIVLSAGKATELFDRSDFPIGHVRDNEYETRRAVFAPGDALLFVSDGVIEASRGEETFGMERLKSEAMRMMNETGSLDLDRVIGSVRAFLGDDPPQDDICLLTVAIDRPDASSP